MRITVQSDPFDMGAEANAFAKTAQGAGAIVTFTGITRDSANADLEVMEIEHYPGMTERALTKIAETAMHRWQLTDCLIIHRFGNLAPNDPIMMVATASRHRADAFAAAEYLMDYLKSRAPFWKKEITKSGAARSDTGWVAARDADEAALKRW